MIAIHNTKQRTNDNLILEGLAEVIADVVNKAIDEKLPQAIETAIANHADGKPLTNQRPNAGGFKLPKSGGYKVPEGD